MFIAIYKFTLELLIVFSFHIKSLNIKYTSPIIANFPLTLDKHATLPDTRILSLKLPRLRRKPRRKDEAPRVSQRLLSS